MPKEIEKKFLFQKNKEWSNLYKDIEHLAQITQNYIFKSEGFEARIRWVDIYRPNRNSMFFLTMKIGEGDIREEIEIELSREQYNNLSQQLKTRPIVKERVVLINDKDYLMIQDDFINVDHPSIIEIEFASEEAMKNFERPDFLGAEIGITNQTIWRDINKGVKKCI